MERVSKNVGRCLTETKRVDFDAAALTFKAFARISQFASQPKHVNDDTSMWLTDWPTLHTGEILYGVGDDGTLTWLGEIIDSSD